MEMIEDLFYFGNIILFFLLLKMTLQILLGVAQLVLKKDGKTTGDEYHRLYVESMEWMSQDRQKPHRR